MANCHIKGCSNSLDWEMNIKTIVHSFTVQVPHTTAGGSVCWCSPSGKQCGWAWADQEHKGRKKRLAGRTLWLCLPERFSQVSKGDGYTTCQGVACASTVEENHLSVTGQENAVGTHAGKLTCIKKPTAGKYADERHAEAEKGTGEPQHDTTDGS